MREKTNKEQRTGTLQPPPQYRRASEQWLSQTLASLLDPVVHKRHVRTVPGRENVDLYGTGFYLKNPTPPGGSRPGDLIGLCTPTETPQGDEEEATEKLPRGLMGRGKKRHSSGVTEYSNTASRRKDEGDCPVVEHKEKGEKGG